MRLVILITIATIGLAFAGRAAQAQEGESGVIRIGEVAAQVGEQVTATLEAVDIPPPGLGAWVIDIMYDPAVATAEACAPLHGGVCSTKFMANTARVTGASAAGLTGRFPLAEITFLCGPEEGGTVLTLSQEIFTTAGFVGTVEFQDLEHGSITCEAEPAPTEEPTATPGMVLPRTGVSNSSDSAPWPWAAGLLAAAGLAAALAGWRLLRRL